jgi:hypothetical protein
MGMEAMLPRKCVGLCHMLSCQQAQEQQWPTDLLHTDALRSPECPALAKAKHSPVFTTRSGVS